MNSYFLSVLILLKELKSDLNIEINSSLIDKLNYLIEEKKEINDSEIFNSIYTVLINFNKREFEISLRKLIIQIDKKINHKEHDPPAVLFSKSILENINKFLLLIRESENEIIRKKIDEIMQLNNAIIKNFNILIMRKENIISFYAIKNINYANYLKLLNNKNSFLHKFKTLELKNILSIYFNNFNNILNKFILSYSLIR